MTDAIVGVAAANTDTVQPLDRKLRADGNSLTLEQHKRNHHWHRATAGATQDTVRHPDYWANLCRKMQRHDLITIIANDESWEILACIEKVLQAGAEISVRKVYRRDSIDHGGRIVDGLGEFFSEWLPNKGWCVIRRKDGIAVVEGFALEALAIADWQKRQPRKAA